MVSTGRHRFGQSAADEQSAVLQVRLPAHRLDQLMLLADRDDTLATTVATDLLLDHLDRLDPDGDFLTVPSVPSAGDTDLASITRLPVMSGMSGGPEMTAVPGRQVAAASVTPLRPGNDCR